MIWNPWRRVRELELALACQRREIEALDHALGQANDRYDRIREANAQMREALSLYRAEDAAQWGSRLAGKLHAARSA